MDPVGWTNKVVKKDYNHVDKIVQVHLIRQNVSGRGQGVLRYPTPGHLKGDRESKTAFYLVFVVSPHSRNKEKY